MKTQRHHKNSINSGYCYLALIMKQITQYITSVLAIVLHAGIVLANNEELISEDARLDFIGLGRKYGHPPNKYDVITEDGYILSLFHLPGRSKTPVLLMHGILDAADTFVLRGNNSLAIILADAGYDVWLGNCRGNIHSRRHLYLDPNKDKEFWNFSFHEMGYYDLPSLIDKVLNKTGATTLSAIGHSQGNTIFFVMGSTRPDYNAKVNVLIALAPICYLHNSTSPFLTIILKSLQLIHLVLTSLKIEANEILGYDNSVTRIMRKICPQPIVGYELCMKGGFFHLFGFDPMEFELAFLNIFIYHHPAGTSWKDVLHFKQIENSKIFRQYDYGSKKNVKMYNSSSPPVYELKKVTIPVILVAANNDPLSTIANVVLLKEQLPNVVDYEVKQRLLFNHGDHIWGRHIRNQSLPYIQRVLSRYITI